MNRHETDYRLYDCNIVHRLAGNNRLHSANNSNQGLEAMTAREYLEQIRTINLKIIAISEEIEEIRAVLGAQAIKYDREPGQASGSDKTFSLICQLIDKQDELMEQYIVLSDKKQEIKEVLYRLSKQIYSEILYKRYFEFKRWDIIAEEVAYNEVYVRQMSRHAMDEIEKLLT